jgi:hypothetical protein
MGPATERGARRTMPAKCAESALNVRGKCAEYAWKVCGVCAGSGAIQMQTLNSSIAEEQM